MQEEVVTYDALIAAMSSSDRIEAAVAETLTVSTDTNDKATVLQDQILQLGGN